MMDKQKTRKVSKATGAELFGRGALKALTISIALAFGTAPIQVSAQETPVQISIPAQSLSNALIQLGEQASLQIFYLPETVSGLNAPAVAGSLTPDQALRRLLVGTGIEVKRNGNTVSLSKPASGNTTQLEPIMVQGSLGAATEDTGSYAAHAVTIGKGVQSLKDIPQSVSVLTNQQIKDQELTTVAEALNQVTGVTYTGWENNEGFLARGFAMSSQQDGVPNLTGATRGVFHPDLAMYDRIEVLRGPSGLLTGNGEPGGTINYVRKRPKDVYAISGALSAGSWRHYRGELDITGPLNNDGTLRGRAVMAYQDAERFYTDNNTDEKFIYGALDYDITPNTTLGLAANYTKRNGVITYWGLPLYDDGSLPDRRESSGTDASSYSENIEVTGDFTHRFTNDWRFKATVNHREANGRFEEAYGLGYLSSATGLGTAYLVSEKIKAKWNSLDANLSGPLTLFGRTHTFTAGYNFSKHENRAYSVGATISNWDILNNHDYSNYRDIVNADDAPNGRYTTYEQSGFYGSGRFKLLDPLTLVIGGRWSNYSEKSRTSGVNSTPWVESKARADNEFTPYGGLIFDLSKNITLYTSYADIFVPQTQQSYTGETLDPRVGWQFEVGAKGEFFDGRLNASIAMFRIRDTNRAMIDEFNVGCGASATSACYRAAGEVQSQGWEAEVTGSPAPGWDISAGYTYTRSKYLSDSNSDNVGARFGATATPIHLFKLWTQYRFNAADFDGALNGWTVGAGVHSQSSTYSSFVKQGGYTTVSAKIGYRFNRNWDATLIANNIFDKKYLRFPGNSGFYNLYGEPRSVLLTVRGSF